MCLTITLSHLFSKANSMKVGITGGIGSGKTTVCKIFESLGIPIYYSDERAKALMVDNEEVKSNIKRLFGENAYEKSGALNRKYIGGIVFNDKSLLEKLNSIVHPAVHKDVELWHSNQTHASYTIREAALLVENGSYKLLDKLIVVAAPEETRVERVMKRDQVAAEEVRLRMSKQLPQSVKIDKADFIINNDGFHFLIPQVMEIHRILTNLD